VAQNVSLLRLVGNQVSSWAVITKTLYRPLLSLLCIVG